MDLLQHLREPLAQADALIFDMDGTLVDSMPVHYEAWCLVARQYGLRLTKARFYELGGVPTYETLQILSRESNKEIDLDTAKEMKETAYRDRLHKVTVIEPMKQLIEWSAGQKPMAIATGASKANATFLLDALGLLPFFSAIVTSDDVSQHKPEPDVFLKAATLMSVKPHRCLAFEDTDLGLKAICAAGMTGVDVRDYSLKL